MGTPSHLRTIFHVDMDAFFVSVEEIFDPSLKGKPVVVGGKPDERGVVSAASYAARKFGVHSAMPLRTAYKMCPQAIFVPGHPTRYREYSEKARAVFELFTPLVEMASIDEAYLDMTGTERLHGPPLAAANALHECMKKDTGLNCSIGIAGSRVVAKIASDQAKPNGVLYAVHGCEASFLAPLPVRKMPGIGKVMEERLLKLGITTLGQLADSEHLPDELRGEYGSSLSAKSRGEDAGAWFANAFGHGDDDNPKSISHEHTFNVDVSDASELETTLLRLCEMVARRLRANNLHARTVDLKLRFSDFKTLSRSRTLDHATQLDQIIYETVLALFHKDWKKEKPSASLIKEIKEMPHGFGGTGVGKQDGPSIRLLGVGVTNLESAPAAQLELLETNTEQRRQRALETADLLRDRFGETAIRLAGGLQRNLRERVHDQMPEEPGKKKKKQ